MSKSSITRVNKALQKAGRAERVVRGKGYWYLYGGDASNFPSTILAAMPAPHEEQHYHIWHRDVLQLFEEAGVKITLEDSNESST